MTISRCNVLPRRPVSAVDAPPLNARLAPLARGLLGALICFATPALAFDVPSGQPVELQEVLVDDLGAEIWLRFRFVAPQIARVGGTVTSGDAAPDMAYLCEAVAVPYIAEYSLTGQVIVVSLADRATEFGAMDPDATQFFEAFRLSDGICIWEGL